MSAAATAWAWAQRGLAADDKLVLLSLAEDANHKAQCWPTRTVLVERTGLREELIAGSLLRLREQRLIFVEEARGAIPTQYFLRLTEFTEPKKRQDVAPVDYSPDVTSQIDEAVTYWAEMARRTKAGPKEHRLAVPRIVTPDMRKKLATRLKSGGLDVWKRAVDAVEHSAWCRGIGSSWRADLSYLLQEKGFAKAANGGWAPDYDEVTRGGTRTAAPGREYERQDSLRGFDAAVRGGPAEQSGRGDLDEGDRVEHGPAGDRALLPFDG